MKNQTNPFFTQNGPLFKLSLLCIIIVLAFLCGMLTDKLFNHNEKDYIINHKIPNNVEAEPKMQYFIARKLKDSLKTIQHPNSVEKLKNIISEIEIQTNLKGLAIPLSASNSNFKVIISENNADDRNEELYLLTSDSFYYLKPILILNK